MCGIAGFWNCGSQRPASGEVVRRMTATLTSRGPDEDGFFVDRDVALGMRRLQVIDPAGGRQPMPNEDGSVQVVYNGEIYNHGELRAELLSLGHRFRTRSDTEVIVHAYEAWGAGCVERFNGMFAFGLWDGAAERLLLARDRMGIKPLYVFEGEEGVVFGSELKSVLTAPWVPFEWDLEAIDDFLTYEYVPAPRTVLRAVRKLDAATTVVYGRERGARGASRRYWSMTPGTAPASASDAAAQLADRLQTSVRRRMIADVPLGAFLSGGIDSSTIVSMMSELRDDPVRTFSIGFKDPSYDERSWARSVAAEFGTDHRELLLEPDAVELAERLTFHFDEPFGDVSAFPTFLVSKLAREFVTVSLSGDGGDELFAGYDQHRAHRWAHRLRWLGAVGGWAVADRLLRLVPPRPQKKGLVNAAKRFVEGVRLPAELEHARWWMFSDVRQRRELFSDDFFSAVEGHDPFGYYRGLLAEGERQGFSGLNRQLYADLRGYLADDILVKVDRMSMATSLEARVPFLDHEVVELAMSMPARWKLAGGTSKWILRQAVRDRLPRTVLTRSKQGFSIPMKNWLRGPLAPLLSELLGPVRVRERGWFRPEEVQRLVREHLEGRANHAHRLWCLLSLELSARHLTAVASARMQPREVAV
jgi:asparagine synthase (glutamine-hydrolysing)